MNIKKLISLLLCLSVIACLLTGCGGDPEPPTMTPPKKWTMQQLSSVTYIGGNKLSYPPKWGDFKKNVTINKENCYEEEGYVTVGLNYKKYDELCTLLFYNEVDKVKELKDGSRIEMIIITRNNPIASKQFSLNGIHFNDTIEDVKEKLGDPGIDDGGDGRFNYRVDNCDIFFEFFKNELWRISFWYSYDDKKADAKDKRSGMMK